MSQDLEIKSAPQRIEVIDPLPLLDTGRFEGMQRIASLMASSSLTPDCLRTVRVLDDEGKPLKENGKNVIEQLPFASILANCFMVVNQSVRWGLDPFAVAQSVSVVSGKLCYEGKLVAGVLDAKLGIELSYEWNDLKGDAYGIVVSGRTQKRGELKSVKGTVGEWKTDRYGSPWKLAANHHRMLAYRGAREWARIHKPSLMLGVYTDDEMQNLEARPRSIAPVQHALGKPVPGVHAYNVYADAQSNTHGSPELDADAAKLKAMGQDAGPPLGPDFVPAPLQTTEAREGEAGPVDENPTASDTATSEATSTASTTSASTPEPATTEDGSPSAAPSSPETTTTAPEGSTAPPQPTEAPAMPDNPTKAEDYEAFWVKCLAICEDRQDAAAEWAGQRKLRTKLAVEMAVVERCKAMVDEQFPKEA